MKGAGFRAGRMIGWALIGAGLVLAACGGGGSGSGASGPAVGPAAISVTMAAATGGRGSLGIAPASDVDFKPVSTFAEIRHVYMEVVKIALMPIREAEFDGDMEGALEDDGPFNPSWPPEKPGFVTLIPGSPTVIDLLRLEDGKRLARFLNRFDSVPAGTYHKIRVYYGKVKVVLEDGSTLAFHPTAHSHFDIHFVGGKFLVIPVSTDTTDTDSWVKFFKVTIDVVGLKIKVNPQGNSWKGAKVILRPQVFAEFVPPILYGIVGVADDVAPANTPEAGEFDILAVGRRIPAAYDAGTDWSFSDNVLACSDWTVDVSDAIGSGALRDRAIVEAVGRFTDGAALFLAREIAITFPDEKAGFVDNGWTPDNTFVLRLPSDNVVFPQPDRFTAYYDNAASPHAPLDESAIDNNVRVRARGYGVTGGIEAFWISIGP